MRADTLVGKTLRIRGRGDGAVRPRDHGFASFERGVDLNSWLLQNGYLALKPGATGEGSYLKEIDWTRTRAYTFGLAGVYINEKGREAQGIVERGARRPPRSSANCRRSSPACAMRARSGGDPQGVAARVALHRTVSRRGARSHRRLHRRLPRQLGCGGRQGDARVFSDNLKAWSGDHCVDPPPGSRRAVLQPRHRRGRPRDRGHGAARRSSCSASRRRRTWRARPC